MPTLDELLVKIDASTELLRRELKKGEGSVSKFERDVDKKLGNIDKRFSKLGAGIKSALGVFGVAAGAAGVVTFTRSVAEAGLEMERFQRALKVATGSQAGAEQEMDFLRQTADRLGLDLRSLTGEYAALAVASKGTALEGQATRDIFVAVSEASAVLGLSAEQTGGALRAIQQIMSKGKVSAEELRGQLGERLYGAFQIAARAIGVTTERLDQMLRNGELAATGLLPKLASELHKTFGPQVADAAGSAQAQINKFNTAIFEMKVAIAESGILGLLTALAQGFGAVATGVQDFFTTTDLERLERIASELRELRSGQAPGTRRSAGSGLMADVMAPVPQENLAARIAALEAEAAEIRNRINDALMIDVEALRANHNQSLEELRRFFAEWRDEAGLIDVRGPSPDAGIAPATVRLGGPSTDQPVVDPEELAAVNEALRQLEEQALRSQGKMAEAIRLSAEAQIAEWQRVALETPAFADKAAEAIRLINERAAADIEALKDARPVIDEFANTFAAAFESRGIDALLNGDISGALRGMAKDLAELIIRLTVLRPLANSFAQAFTGGGGLVGFFGSLFGGGDIPGRQSGGPVEAGQPYFVHKDEMFVPDVPGRILSAAQVKRMGGAQVAVNQEFHVQAGLPPQWHQQTFTAAQLAAAAAKEAVTRELGGRR